MSFYVEPRTDTTIAPFRRTVGHEVEYSSGVAIAQLLQGRGHGTPPRGGESRLHGYGCNCEGRDNFPIHTTSDGSAPGGEYLIGGSRGVLFGSPKYGIATKVLSEAAIEANCGTNTNVGMHTHVGVIDPDGVRLTDQQSLEVLRTYLRYQDEIIRLAMGPLSEVRSNGNMRPYIELTTLCANAGITEHDFWNSDVSPSILPGRPTLNFHTGKSTIEFRIWNSTKAQWRMVMAGAVSAAIVEAAAQNRKVQAEGVATLTDFLKGLLGPDILVLINRQRKKTHA